MIGYFFLVLFVLALMFCTYFIGACLIAASRECILPGIEDIEA
ncbi:MAG: hypothetical protein ABIK15_20590 [Pseudomonadota bacterium]